MKAFERFHGPCPKCTEFGQFPIRFVPAEKGETIEVPERVEHSCPECGWSFMTATADALDETFNVRDVTWLGRNFSVVTPDGVAHYRTVELDEEGGTVRGERITETA